MSRRTNLIAVCWILLVLLSSVYLITYRGLFRSIDELALFSMTESLVQTGTLDTPQLAFASYHNGVGRLEPLHSLLAVPLYWSAVHVGRLGNIQTVMLQNVFVTAMTGVVLCGTLRALEQPPVRALVVALIYGLATLAWPYSRSFYREPSLALLLAVATLGFVQWRQTRRLGFVALMLVCLILAVSVKLTAAFVWLAFAAAFVLEPAISGRARLGRCLALLLVGALGAATLAAVYATRTGNSALRLLAYLGAWESPALVLRRVFGLTFGAARGLFVFSPVLLLALPGLVMLWHRRRAEAILCLVATLVFLAGYAAYSDWHGGMSWGPRFLVPLVPFLMLPVAEWLSLKGKAWQIATGLLALLSVVVQLVASTVDYSLQVEAQVWENLVDYTRSPVLQQFLIWRPRNFDMLWWHGPVRDHLEQPFLDWRIVVLLCISGLAAAAMLIVDVRNSATAPRPRAVGRVGAGRGWGRYALLGLSLTVGVLVLLLRAPEAMLSYPGVDPAELWQVAERINQGREPRAIVTVSNDFHLNVLLNGFKGRFVHYWISPAQTDDFEALGRPPFPAHSLHLIVDRVHLQPEHSGREAEFWLNANLHRYFVDWLGSGYQVYSYLYPPPQMPLVQVEYLWAPGMAVLAHGVTPQTVAPGDPIWLELHCSAAQQPDADYDVFVQFLGPDGRFVQGTDGPPQFGAEQTSRWQPGETIIDRRALFVPRDSPPGIYQVVAGFYAGEKRQPVFDGSGRALGSYIVLGRVEVTS